MILALHLASSCFYRCPGSSLPRRARRLAKAAGREGGGGGVGLAASGDGTKRRAGKQALPTHAPQLRLKVLTTRERHSVQGEGSEVLDTL